MNTFANAVINQFTVTENGMPARVSTANACVDLFYKIGASRGKDVIPNFVAAYVEDQDIALRIAQWSRDVRGGAGERQIFRNILKYLETNVDNRILSALLRKVPEIGRWDDLLCLETPYAKNYAFALISNALEAGNGLCAKWMPREKSSNHTVATELRKFMGLSPRSYRKLLVDLTKVVESQMCGNDWDEINFSHVPSLAHARYKKAFNKHTPKYAEYVAKLVAGDKDVKVNASTAVYPYDVLKGYCGSYADKHPKTENDLTIQQWNALVNFIGDANILPMVDVSGSMSCSVGNNKNLDCMTVAISLGLYMADKNTGKFKDTFLTFSGKPDLVTLQGNILQKVQQMSTSKWAMNTDLESAIATILRVAIEGKVPASEMPKALVVLSDMQFDRCTRLNDSAMDMMRRMYAEAGYEIPMIVFWNLNSYENAPAKFDERGVVLISGFSPAVMKAVLKADFSDLTPEALMLNVIMIDRYSL